MMNKRLKILAGIEILMIVILISGCIFYDQDSDINKEWVEISIFCQCCKEPWGYDDNITPFFEGEGIEVYGINIGSRGPVCEACECPSYEIKEILINSGDKDKLLEILSAYENISGFKLENHQGDKPNENGTLNFRYHVSECNEPWENMSDSVEIEVMNGIIKINQNLPYVCCANITLNLEQKENILKIIETNIGEVCKCRCMYYVNADIANLKKGNYTIEIWGVRKEGYPTHYKKIYGGTISYQKQNQVCIKDNCFYVELAITPKELSRGLMFREHLDLDRGMLFIFEEEKEYPFWMKNTLIPLDIIWINKNKEVVFISRNTQPCKSDIYICPNINPGKKATYVLELNGGISDKIGLAVGDDISIEFFNLK